MDANAGALFSQGEADRGGSQSLEPPHVFILYSRALETKNKSQVIDFFYGTAYTCTQNKSCENNANRRTYVKDPVAL